MVLIILIEKKKGDEKMKKKWLALLISVAMLITLLASCADREPEETSDVSSTPEETDVEIDYSEHKEYTWWLFADTFDWYSNYSDNPGVQYFNRKFNTTLKFEHPPMGSEVENLNIMLATGDYTDIIDTNHYQGSINELYRDGVIVDLAPYLKYMPNLSELFEKDPLYRKHAFNDDGQMLELPDFKTSRENPWGGLVYRADILDTMTGGNTQFPSGNDIPTTIEDWDYMLPLFKAYFEAAGMDEYAPLIIPANGIFGFSEILSGFGSHFHHFLDDGEIQYGPFKDGYYNYLAKLREWYEAGYIYQDFASRTMDPFYLPNTSLTYGGAAGVWFGLGGQLGTAMSMPEYGLEMDVRAIPSPIDAENGITKAPNYLTFGPPYMYYGGAAITTACTDVERLLASLDFFYGEEGSLIRTFGLNAEQATDDDLYNEVGLENGIYSFDEDDNIVFNEVLYSDPKYARNINALSSERLPGLLNRCFPVPFYREELVVHYDNWMTYPPDDYGVPVGSLYRLAEEESEFISNQTNLTEYLETKTVRFILGAEELNETTWAEFQEQLRRYGAEDNLEMMKSAYERFLVR